MGLVRIIVNVYFVFLKVICFKQLTLSKNEHIATVCNEKRVNQINWNTGSCIEEKESGGIPDSMTFWSNTSSEKEYQPMDNFTLIKLSMICQ